MFTAVGTIYSCILPFVDSQCHTEERSFAGLVSPGDAILGTGDMLTDSTYWLQAKSAIILESQPRPASRPTSLT